MWIVKGRKGDASVLGNLGELREGSMCDAEYKVAKRIYCGESMGAPHGNE